MPSPEPSLRDQLLEGREKVQRQIDKLRARPYPSAGAPIATNGVAIDNSALIARLEGTLNDIEHTLRWMELKDG
jgi:hypothetical protein